MIESKEKKTLLAIIVLVFILMVTPFGRRVVGSTYLQIYYLLGNESHCGSRGDDASLDDRIESASTIFIGEVKNISLLSNINHRVIRDDLLQVNYSKKGFHVVTFEVRKLWKDASDQIKNEEIIINVRGDFSGTHSFKKGQAYVVYTSRNEQPNNVASYVNDLTYAKKESDSGEDIIALKAADRESLQSVIQNSDCDKPSKFEQWWFPPVEGEI